MPRFTVKEKEVLRNKPLTRGNGGKPHWAEFCYRTGGETVYVCSQHPNGAAEIQYKGILANNPKAKSCAGRRYGGIWPCTFGAVSVIPTIGPSCCTVASGPDEHGRSVQGDEERGLPGLTTRHLQTKTARGGKLLLRAVGVFGAL